MKKTAAVILAIIVCFSLFGCTPRPEPKDNAPTKKYYQKADFVAAANAADAFIADSKAGTDFSLSEKTKITTDQTHPVFAIISQLDDQALQYLILLEYLQEPTIVDISAIKAPFSMKNSIQAKDYKTERYIIDSTAHSFQYTANQDGELELVSSNTQQYDSDYTEALSQTTYAPLGIDAADINGETIVGRTMSYTPENLLSASERRILEDLLSQNGQELSELEQYITALPCVLEITQEQVLYKVSRKIRIDLSALLIVTIDQMLLDPNLDLPPLVLNYAKYALQTTPLNADIDSTRQYDFSKPEIWLDLE